MNFVLATLIFIGDREAALIGYLTLRCAAHYQEGALGIAIDLST